MAEEPLAVARGIVAGILRCPVDAVAGTDRVGALPGWDSIAHLNILLAAEERSGRRFAAGEIASVATVEDIASLLEAAPAARSGA